MKKIGYVLTDFPVFSETFVGTEMRAMAAKGHTILPFAFFSDPTKGQLADADLAKKTSLIGSVDNLSAVFFLLKKFTRLRHAFNFVRQQKGLPKKSLLIQGAKLALLSQRQNVQHLHAHFALNSAATAIVAAKLLGISVSFVGHGYDVYATPSDLNLKLSTADFSVAVCEQMKWDFEAISPASRTIVVECGIDLSRYHFEPTLEHNNTLLFIGRLTEKKGIDTLLESLATLPSSQRPKLHIVGNGEDKDKLLTLSSELALQNHVEFLGPRSSQWIQANAPHYTALVAPFREAKNGDRDTGPVVVKEAMALGLPVITTYFMGCLDILTPTTGARVQTNNSAQLAEAITHVLSLDSKSRLSLLQEARERVEQNYDANVTTNKLSTAIERVAS